MKKKKRRNTRSPQLTWRDQYDLQENGTDQESMKLKMKMMSMIMIMMMMKILTREPQHSKSR
jgi:hypothetical protein